jgi:hypothetical protein
VVAAPEAAVEKEGINDDDTQVVVADFETSDDDEPTNEEKQTLRRGNELVYL